MKNKIRTMQGKSIDFEELALRNEKTIAMGNMGVNAAGEEVKADSPSDRKKRDKKSYRRQIQKKVFDLPVLESQAEATKFQRNLAKEYAKEEKRVETKVEEVLEYKTVADSPETIEIDKQANKPKAADILVAPTMVTKLAPQPKVESKDKQKKRLEEVINDSKSGLASAIAKAKQVKQEAHKSPREQLRAKDGVKKI